MTLHINNPKLEAQLEISAQKKGQQPEALASTILMRSLDSENRYEREKTEDEKRWQTYKQGGNTITHKDMKSHFSELRAEAIKRASEIG